MTAVLVLNGDVTVSDAANGTKSSVHSKRNQRSFSNEEGSATCPLIKRNKNRRAPISIS